MNRLHLISQTNPVWAIHISEFVEHYPEFKPYVTYAPAQQFSAIPYPHVHTLFEAIVFYICCAGVRFDYAIKQWELIYPLLKSDDWDFVMANMLSMECNPNIQNSKKSKYAELCIYINEKGCTHNTLTVDMLHDLQKNVKGIGVGCVAWCKKYLTTDDDCVEYTDIKFKKGFAKIYGDSKLSEMKKKSQEWVNRGYGRIGNLFVMNICGYA